MTHDHVYTYCHQEAASSNKQGSQSFLLVNLNGVKRLYKVKMTPLIVSPTTVYQVCKYVHNKVYIFNIHSNILEITKSLHTAFKMIFSKTKIKIKNKR